MADRWAIVAGGKFDNGRATLAHWVSGVKKFEVLVSANHAEALKFDTPEEVGALANLCAQLADKRMLFYIVKVPA